MNIDQQFCKLLEDIMNNGKVITARNSLTKRKINQSVTFDSTPLISIRRTAWKNALREFEWFMSGSNNIQDLHEKVRKWWEPWANGEGKIISNYSKQFRNFDGYVQLTNYNLDGDVGVDQIKYMIETLKNHPNSRRNVITTWNTAEMVSPHTPITNCHGTVIQAFVDPASDKIDLSMYQRSSDMVLGLPHNFIQYWAFLHYLAHQSGRKVGSFHWMGGDCHIYEDHIDMAVKMMYNKKLAEIETPQLIYTPTSDDFKADDFSLDKEYKPLIKQSLKMSV